MVIESFDVAVESAVVILFFGSFDCCKIFMVDVDVVVALSKPSFAKHWATRSAIIILKTAHCEQTSPLPVIF